jgi:hypothetical protein
VLNALYFAILLGAFVVVLAGCAWTVRRLMQGPR